jgi:hypothetical protein
MKKVFFRSPGCLNLCGKVRKSYQIGDTLKLKSMACLLEVVEINNNEIMVKKAV